MIKVKVEKLQKSFGSLEVLKGIDLEVKEGEVVCLIGPSGSGKSTFLRCLNRLEETTAGTVIVDDNDITDPKCNINKVRENIPTDSIRYLPEYHQPRTAYPPDGQHEIQYPYYRDDLPSYHPHQSYVS